MKKILVVDNNLVTLNLLNSFLTRQGYEVITAEDGLTVLKVLRNFMPDVIFLDLVMPNIDGEKLCRIIRSTPALKDVSLVILSGLAAELKIDFANWGANACIAKGPFPIMSKRIMTVLENLEQNRELDHEVMGLTDVFPREITQELLSVKRHLEVILSSISEGILEISSDAKIVYANPEAVSIIGLPEVELLGSDFLEMFHELDIPKISALLEKQGKVSRVSSEEFLLANDKEVSVNVMPIRDEKNKGIIILNDISTESA